MCEFSLEMALSFAQDSQGDLDALKCYKTRVLPVGSEMTEMLGQGQDLNESGFLICEVGMTRWICHEDERKQCIKAFSMVVLGTQ